MRFLVLFLLCAQVSLAQFDHGCDGERYINEVLPDVDVETVIYGSNVDVFGDSIDLRMDIYLPQNDPAVGRPVIIFAHGGSFIGGNRQDMNQICRRYARSGYVSATIDYRLLSLFQGLPDSVKALDIAVKASHDMKGAIRWFKNSALADGNPYNVDPDMMFIGGYSAGAVVALIAGTFDEDEATQPFLAELLEDNGGFQGSTGNPAFLPYGEDVRGIVNYSGAIYDTAWIDEDDPIITSYHGTADETVPYDYNFVIVLGQEIVPLHGSGSIHPYLTSKGISNYLYTVEGGGHTDIYFTSQYDADRVQALAASDTIFGTIICGSLVDNKEVEFLALKAYPNPAQSLLFLEGLEPSSQVVIYDNTGQIVSSVIYNEALHIETLPSGVYYYSTVKADKKCAGKFVKI